MHVQKAVMVFTSSLSACNITSLFKLYVFVYVGCAGSSLLCVGFLRCGQWLGCFLLTVPRFLLAVAPCAAEHGPYARGFGPVARGLSRCSSQALERGLSSRASRHVESSWTEHWTDVPCIARQIGNHWTSKETLTSFNVVFLIISSFPRYFQVIDFCLSTAFWRRFTALRKYSNCIPPGSQTNKAKNIMYHFRFLPCLAFTD